MGKSSSRSYIDAFRFDDCVECGECLSSCKYMGISEEESIDAVRKLRQGAEADAVLDKCTFCGQCDDRCPVDARPVALMLERLRDRRKAEESIPMFAAYYFAGIEGLGATQDYFKDVYLASSEETKAIIQKWSEPKQCEDLLWCGCGNRMTPQNMEYSNVLSDLPKFGGVSDCCGVNEAKAGLYDAARHVTENLLEKLSKSKFKRLVVSCGSCQEHLTLLYPEYFGGELPFEVISLYEYIDERMVKENVRVQRKVDLDMALSDACYGYRFGDRYLDTVRKLCDAIGIRAVELRHKRENTTCCGVSGLARRFRMEDVTDAMRLKAEDIRESRMEHVLHYCMGCHTMSAMVHAGRSHYLLDKVLWALGDDMTSSIHIPREAREKAKVRFQDQGRFYLPAI